MRNIITILFVILSINLNAQTVGRLPYGITIQSFKGDTLKTSVKNTNNYAEFYTNKNLFEFKKPITIQSNEYSVINNLQVLDNFKTTTGVYFEDNVRIYTDVDLYFKDNIAGTVTLSELKDKTLDDDILDFNSGKYTPYVGLPADNSIPRLFTGAGFNYGAGNFEADSSLNVNVPFRVPILRTNGIAITQTSYVGILGETSTGGVNINSIYNGGAGFTLDDNSNATLQGEPLIKITQKANAARPTINLINKIQDTATVFNYNDRVKIKGSGFTQLGEVAPAIKFKELTGTTASIEGGSIVVAHGLTGAKIISFTCVVRHSANRGMAPQYTFDSGYLYSVFYNDTNFVVNTDNINSENILSKPFTIFIIYKE
jgi:hypothetical protein